jgi:hypothetical protein
MELLQEWTKTAGSVVNEQIEELEAYELDDVDYANSVVDFTVNMSTLSFLEIMFVLNDDALIRMLAETCPIDILLKAAAERTELQDHGEISGDPENLGDWDKEAGGKDGS